MSATGPLVWSAGVATALGTWAFRASVVFLFGYLDAVPPWVARTLRFIPPAIIAAIILPRLLVVDGSVAPTGEDNPTLSLTVGRRYTVENRGWGIHPFALLDADGAVLCSQDSDGRLEAEPDVDWTDEGDRFAFTVTETLASAVDTYVCTVHRSMRGDVTAGTDDPTPTASPTPTDGGSDYY